MLIPNGFRHGGNPSAVRDVMLETFENDPSSEGFEAALAALLVSLSVALGGFRLTQTVLECR